MSQPEDMLALFIDPECAQIWIDTQILLMQNRLRMIGLTQSNRPILEAEIARYQTESESIINEIIKSLEDTIAMEAEI